MQENLREFSNKLLSALKSANTKVIGGIILIVMLLSAGIIALTQEEPSQVNDFTQNNDNEEENTENTRQDFFYNYKPDREIPSWIKPARWFRSNSGGMPLEEMKSRVAAMRGQYALVIDFTHSDELPDALLDYYNEDYFIEVRTLYKDGKEDRTQWIFRDENYGVRLIAVLLEAEQDTDNENIETSPVDAENIADTADDTVVEPVVIHNTVDDSAEKEEAHGDIDIIETNFENKITPVKRSGPANGFIEIYDDKYHLTEEYRYSEKGEDSKIEYSYNGSMKVSAQVMLWDIYAGDYIQSYTDYYRYNRSSFLRAVERVFLKDQKIKSADNVIAGSGAASGAASGATSGVINLDDNNSVKISFPSNILAAARNSYFMGEKFNSYPEFFGDLLVSKDSKLIFTTDDRGRVLSQTLVGNDEKQTVIWKIENTWSGDRIVKMAKTEGETVLLAEFVYNKNEDKILERNIKDGVLERVVRSEGRTDIEELYLNNKLVLQAVWEDGRKISESRIK